MKETLIELGIPAFEVPIDKQMVEAHDLTVTPTLITYTNDELGRVHGGRSTKDLKQWINKL